MGRKDACGFQSQPVDQYRKQIGKQDWKKSKRDVKCMKNRSDQTNVITPQQIVLMIGLVVTLLSALYILLFWYLGTVRLEDMRERPPS